MLERQRKKGIFLTIEMLAVIIVIIFILSMVMISGLWIISSKEISAVVNEISQLKEQATTFKGLYNNWPGEIRLENLGDPRNTQLNIGYVQTRTPYAFLPSNNTWLTSGGQQAAAAAQLRGSGLISSKHLDVTKTCNNPTSIYTLNGSESGCQLNALFDNAYIWLFNPNLSQLTGTDYGAGLFANGFYGATLTYTDPGAVTDPNLQVQTYLSTIRNSPSFMLINTKERRRPAGVVAANGLGLIGLSGFAQSELASGMPIKKSEQIAKKLNSSQPQLAGNMVFAEDISTTMGTVGGTTAAYTTATYSFSCTNKVFATAYTVPGLKAAAYKQATDLNYNALPQGCVLIFRI